MFHCHVWNTWKANRLHILPLPSMGFPFGRDLHMYPRGVCSISILVFWEVTNHTKQLLFLQSSVSRHNHPSFQKSLGERLLLKKQHQNDHPNIHWSEIASWCWGPFSKELINSKSWVFFATTNRPEIVFYCGNQNLFGKIKMIIAGGTLLSIPDNQKKVKQWSISDTKIHEGGLTKSPQLLL